MPTDLRPRQLRQAPNKLRCGVDAELERFLVDDLADSIPEGGLEALILETLRQYRSAGTEGQQFTLILDKLILSRKRQVGHYKEVC